jgi:hypothetical protein
VEGTLKHEDLLTVVQRVSNVEFKIIQINIWGLEHCQERFGNKYKESTVNTSSELQTIPLSEYNAYLEAHTNITVLFQTYSRRLLGDELSEQGLGPCGLVVMVRATD